MIKQTWKIEQGCRMEQLLLDTKVAVSVATKAETLGPVPPT